MPTIVIDQTTASIEPLKVVFAPAAEPASVSGNTIRFSIVPGETPPAPANPGAATLTAAPASPTPLTLLASSTAAAKPADVVDSTTAVAATSPAISFSPPRYEPPKPEPKRYEFSRFERDILAACLVLEAASQGEFGMRAVMAVIRNRAESRPERFVRTVLQPKQFSALNTVTAGRESLASLIRRAKRDRVWTSAVAIVGDALHDTWHDPTGGATHYTRAAEHTHWTRRLAKTTTIGAHSFYR